MLAHRAGSWTVHGGALFQGQRSWTIATVELPADYGYTPTTTLVADLRRGGYILFFRHAATDRSQKDRDVRDLSNCSTQRNLSPTGQADARRIGVIMQQLQIPIGEVLASPYCRTLDTAKLAFGRATPTPYLLANFYDPLTARDRLETLVQELGKRPASGNTVLVGHGVNLAASLEINLQEGDAAIFQPMGGDRFNLVRIIRVAEWNDLRTTN